jgi:hypothetical protein
MMMTQLLRRAVASSAGQDEGCSTTSTYEEEDGGTEEEWKSDFSVHCKALPSVLSVDAIRNAPPSTGRSVSSWSADDDCLGADEFVR